MIDLTNFSQLVIPDVLHCPSIMVTQAVKQSIIDFSEKTWIFSKSFNKVLSSTDIVTTINDYVDIDVGEYVTEKAVVAIDQFKIDGFDWDLKYVELENESNFVADLRLDTEKMFSFPDNTTVRIHEMESGYELFLKVIYKPIYNITTIDDILYNDYVEPIVAGAKYRLMTIPGQAWSNPGLAQYNESLWKRGMSEARRKISQYTSQRKRVNWRRFGD